MQGQRSGEVGVLVACHPDVGPAARFGRRPVLDGQNILEGLLERCQNPILKLISGGFAREIDGHDLSDFSVGVFKVQFRIHDFTARFHGTISGYDSWHDKSS
jgi:hypothetical protein